MRIKKLTPFVVCIMCLCGSAYAQTLHKSRGPAEIPPASYKGQQYIDSKGCVYIRAGYGANVRWVPRVNRKRQVICSSKYKPSLSNSQLASASNVPSKTVQKPQPVKTQTKQKAKTQVKTAPVQRATPKQTQKRSTITPANPDSTSIKPLANTVITQVPQQTGIITKPSPDYTPTKPLANVVITEVPQKNGVNSDITAAGDAEMDQIWSNTVPRKLINKNTSGQPAEISSSNTVAYASGRYIQVATFGDPNNAQRTAARFKSNGLPVRTRDVQVNGRAFKVVLLGPFNANTQVSSALSAANVAGFRDAFVTR